LDNEDNTYWNNYARSTGYASQTAFYQMWLPIQERRLRRQLYTDEEKAEALRKIKRREPA
jgi:hypothetical protein